MHDASYYREQAERARRLAGGHLDAKTREALQQVALDYSEIAEDLEQGAVEVRHPDLMPQNRDR